MLPSFYVWTSQLGPTMLVCSGIADESNLLPLEAGEGVTSCCLISEELIFRRAWEWEVFSIIVPQTTDISGLSLHLSIPKIQAQGTVNKR